MRQFLNNVTGVNSYLIFSMIVFMLFFIGLVIWVIKADKKYINKMKNLPLDEKK